MFIAYVSATISLLLSIFVTVLFAFLMLTTGKSIETFACLFAMSLSICVSVATTKQAITYYKYSKID
ncbi:hypothetical protein ACJ8P3_003199 [Acinetobacter baumannii]